MKISDYYTYASKSKIKAGDANHNGKYQFYASSPDKSRRCDEYLYDCKAIIMGTGGSATLHYYDGKFSTSTDCLTLIPNEKIRAKYLYYFFLASMDVLEAGFKGAGLKHTNKDYIDSIEITKIPSLPSQDKIVNLFDELASRIEKERRQIEKLDDLIKARFVEMFGDKEEMKISGYIDSLEAGKSLAGTEKCENKVLKTGAVSYDYFDNTQTKYLPKDYQPLNAHKVNPGDVIISRMNTIDLVGAATYVWNVPDKVYLPDRLWKAKLKNDANPIFVWQTIIHPKTKKLIRRMAGGTSGSMKNISKNKFLEMLVKKATREEQDQFAAFVAQVDKSKFALVKSIKLLKSHSFDMLLGLL